MCGAFCFNKNQAKTKIKNDFDVLRIIKDLRLLKTKVESLQNDSQSKISQLLAAKAINEAESDEELDGKDFTFLYNILLGSNPQDRRLLSKLLKKEMSTTKMATITP